MKTSAQSSAPPIRPLYIYCAVASLHKFTNNLINFYGISVLGSQSSVWLGLAFFVSYIHYHVVRADSLNFLYKSLHSSTE